ncbi:unnamed protein product [Amoebophrya sp. A25]|nr:unnamed protein product [Amoebophrya sp. A25]|eukprot:GSA25T00021211001.1
MPDEIEFHVLKQPKKQDQSQMNMAHHLTQTDLYYYASTCGKYKYLGSLILLVSGVADWRRYVVSRSRHLSRRRIGKRNGGYNDLVCPCALTETISLTSSRSEGV